MLVLLMALLLVSSLVYTQAPDSTGAVNGVSGYNFLLTLTDGQINGGGGVDKFRIKIWDASGVVYDNMIGYPEDMDGANPQAIGGGNIEVHTK